MNLIKKVKALGLAEKKATHVPWDQITIEGPIYGRASGKLYPHENRKWKEDEEFIPILRNAAPAMLAVLGQVHEGDTERIHTVLLALETQPDLWGSCIEVLHRYQVMAKAMEAEE